MSLQHTTVNRSNYFYFGLKPCAATWNVEPQVSVDYPNACDENNCVEAHAWVRAPGAYFKGLMLSVHVTAAPSREETEQRIIEALLQDKDFSDNLLEYLGMVVEKPD